MRGLQSKVKCLYWRLNIMSHIMFTDPGIALLNVFLIVGAVLALVLAQALKANNKKLHQRNADQRKRIGY